MTKPVWVFGCEPDTIEYAAAYLVDQGVPVAKTRVLDDTVRPDGTGDVTAVFAWCGWAADALVAIDALELDQVRSLRQIVGFDVVVNIDPGIPSEDLEPAVCGAIAADGTLSGVASASGFATDDADLGLPREVADVLGVGLRAAEPDDGDGWCASAVLSEVFAAHVAAWEVARRADA